MANTSAEFMMKNGGLAPKKSKTSEMFINMCFFKDIISLFVRETEKGRAQAG